MELNHFQIIATEQDGYSLIKLANIPFHIQGGGQPSDKLADREGLSVEIIKHDSDILLRVPTTSIINQNKIELYIDSEFHTLCSRLHSAGHFINTI